MLDLLAKGHDGINIRFGFGGQTHHEVESQVGNSASHQLFSGGKDRWLVETLVDHPAHALGAGVGGDGGGLDPALGQGLDELRGESVGAQG